jgi:hypothetical protein
MYSPVPLLAALLLGSMLFFAALVAPSVHKLLDAENASRYLNDLFPRFYLWGIGLSGLGTAIAVFNKSATFMLTGIVMLGFVYARQYLNPKIDRAGEKWHSSDVPQDKAVFDKLYKQSVLLNTIQIVLLTVIIFAG